MLTLPQGTEVELFVSTGKTSYSYTVTVDDLPKNFKENYTVTLEAQIGGKIIDTLKVKINDYDGSWTVDITGVTDKTATVYINITSDKINIDKALTYTIDMVNRKDSASVSAKVENYLADDTSSGSSSADSTSSAEGTTSSGTSSTEPTPSQSGNL